MNETNPQYNIRASIIVPAKNEATNLEHLLYSIQDIDKRLGLEILVIDNMSVDDTARIAKKYGAHIIQSNAGTIAAVRNDGAKKARGNTFIFLDADIEVSKSWKDSIPEVIEELENDPMLLTGAKCHAATTTRYLDKYWFNRLAETPSDYIISGILIINRVLFNKIHGFDEALATSEDYDICIRASSIGAKILNNKALKVYHIGFPNKISEFCTRERWHGFQDYASLKSTLKSKTAMLAIVNLLILLTNIFAFVLCQNYTFIALSVIWLFLVGITLAFHRFGYCSLKLFFNSSLVFALYICCRSISAVDRILRLPNWAGKNLGHRR